MSAVTTLLQSLYESVLFIVLGHVSLPRALNMYNLRHWDRHGKGIFYQYTPALYTWPLVSVGFYSLLCDSLQLMSNEALGWIWTITLLMVLLTLVIDIKSLGVVMTSMLIGLILAIGRLVEVELGIPLRALGWDVLSGINMTFPRGVVLLTTIVVAMVYLSMFFWKRMDSVITVEGDQITVHNFGAQAQMFPRDGWVLHAQFEDVLEWLLGGGAGTLILAQPITKQKLLVIRHVPGYKAIAAEVRKRLSVTNVEVAAPAALPEERPAQLV